MRGPPSTQMSAIAPVGRRSSRIKASRCARYCSRVLRVASNGLRVLSAALCVHGGCAVHAACTHSWRVHARSSLRSGARHCSYWMCCAGLRCYRRRARVLHLSLFESICLFSSQAPSLLRVLSPLLSCSYRCACYLPALACLLTTASYASYSHHTVTLILCYLLSLLRYTVHVHSSSSYRLRIRSAPCSPCRAPASRWLRCYAVYHIRCFHLLIDL